MKINLNNLISVFDKPEPLVDPESFKDPLALKTSWEPLKYGGTNVRTHFAIQTGANRIEFKPTMIMKILPLVFGIVPFVVATLIIKGSVEKNGEFVIEKSLIPMAVFVLIFLATALALYWSNAKAIVFDKNYGYFWKGKRDQPGEAFNPAEQKESVKLSEIHSLQIIHEWVQGGRRTRSFKSYELNLVLKSGERMSVVDHGDWKKLSEDAAMLAKFLSVPIWGQTQTL